MKEGSQEETNRRRGPVMPLKKDGGELRAEWARAWQEELGDLLEDHPEHFRALHALVEGRGEEVRDEVLRQLQEWDYLGRDLLPAPNVRAVMKAAVRVTGDGFTVVDPIRYRNREDVATAEQLDAHARERRRRGILRWVRRLGDEDKDKGGGRSK